MLGHTRAGGRTARRGVAKNHTWEVAEPVFFFFNLRWEAAELQVGAGGRKYGPGIVLNAERSLLTFKSL